MKKFREIDCFDAKTLDRPTPNVDRDAECTRTPDSASDIALPGNGANPSRANGLDPPGDAERGCIRNRKSSPRRALAHPPKRLGAGLCPHIWAHAAARSSGCDR